MIKYIYFIAIIFSFCTVEAQEDMVFPRSSIGYTPTALLNGFPGIQISYDQAISNKWNFSTETAFIFASLGNGSTEGFRFRPGVEFFIARSSWVSLVSGFHVNYRYTTSYNNLSNIASNGEFSFLSYNQKETQSFIGLAFENKLVFKVSKRWYINLGGGFGGGVLSSNVNQPDFQAELQVGNFITALPLPIFYTHLNFSYALSL